MISHRFAADVCAADGHERLVDGSLIGLVRLRLYDGPGNDSAPDVFTDLRPDEARRLAIALQRAARGAEANVEVAS